MYPRCGELSDIYVKNLELYSAKCGKAALMIRPPMLCPIKEIFEISMSLHASTMYYFTSKASL